MRYYVTTQRWTWRSEEDRRAMNLETGRNLIGEPFIYKVVVAPPELFVEGKVFNEPEEDIGAKYYTVEKVWTLEQLEAQPWGAAALARFRSEDDSEPDAWYLEQMRRDFPDAAMAVA